MGPMAPFTVMDEDFGRAHTFLREDARSRCAHLEIWTSAQMRQSTAAIGRCPHIFNVKDVLALFALENLKTSTSSSYGGMAAGWNGFFRKLLCFYDSVHSDVESWLSGDVLIAFDGQQFDRLWTNTSLSSSPQQERRLSNLGRLRFNRRGASTPLWRVESCSLPSRWPNPTPAIPPYVVRIPHLHGAPTTEKTSTVKLRYLCQHI